jgi:hypothetical protein
MRDPRRWRDDPSGPTRSTEVLLRGARRPQPPGSHELERLGAAVEQISRMHVAPPVSWLRLAVAGALAFMMVGGGTFVWALHARDARRAAAAAAAEAKARELARAQQPKIATLGPAVFEPVPIVATAPTRSSRRHAAEARVAAPAPAEAPAPTDALAREVPLIDAGRADLGTAPTRALASLEAHRRQFPHGQLAAEREFLAVQALVQMNRTAEAKTRAEELATRYPQSSYAARATRLIEEVEAQKATVPAHDRSRGAPLPGSQRDRDRL